MTALGTSLLREGRVEGICIVFKFNFFIFYNDMMHKQEWMFMILNIDRGTDSCGRPGPARPRPANAVGASFLNPWFKLGSNIF